jgi:4-hydroxybenzoate polyprenyltransferase
MSETPSSPSSVARNFAEQSSRLGEMIKFPHSVFALPFALSAMLVAAGGLPRLSVLFWIVAACVSARTMAMTYNRLADREIDARNPRTRDRALVTGEVSIRFAWAIAVGSGLAFVFCAAMLNGLCLALSPVAIAVLLGYSHAKRWTEYSHFLLGAALGIAPLGAWIAVRGSLEGLPVFLSLGVILWTAGFDIVYACQDAEVDRHEGLFAIPARLGIKRALRIAAVLHAFSVVCFGLFVLEWRLVPVSPFVLVLIALLLRHEHRLVRPDDLSRVGPAFFNVNAIVSTVFFAGCAIDVFFGR